MQKASTPFIDTSITGEINIVMYQMIDMSYFIWAPFRSLGNPWIPNQARAKEFRIQRSTSRNKMKRVRVSVSHSATMNTSKGVKTLQNREGNEGDRTNNQQSIVIPVSHHQLKPNTSSKGILELTDPFDNKPIAPVLRGGRLPELIENSSRLKQKRRSATLQCAKIDCRSFRDIF